MNYYDHKLNLLKEEKAKLTLWAKVFATPLGNKALEELKRRREGARDTYKLIPAHDEKALIMLIEAQHMEKFHAKLIQSVENAQQREKDIDKEMEKVVNEHNRSQRLRREDVVYTGDKDDRS